MMEIGKRDRERGRGSVKWGEREREGEGGLKMFVAGFEDERRAHEPKNVRDL